MCMCVCICVLSSVYQTRHLHPKQRSINDVCFQFLVFIFLKCIFPNNESLSDDNCGKSLAPNQLFTKIFSYFLNAFCLVTVG